MADRQKLTIPFGGGLDRATGVAVLEATAFSDLRNVHLLRGRATLRKGLERTVSAVGDDALLAVAPIRSQGIGAVITWRAADRSVRLYLVSGDASALSFVDVLWTLPANATPRVSADDSYGKLFVAHDEPVFALRQNTKVYDYLTGSVSDYTADLYKPNDPDGDGIGADLVPVKFRRVKRWLNYLLGLGYGTEVVAGENDGEDDRPEIVRVSLPGQPTVMLPESYFIAGQRGEAALACQPTQGGLLVLKDADSYRIEGTDAESFGIFPADPDYGVAGSELSVSVGGVCHFWSLHGPRASSGGPSVDLSIPLDLDGPLPDILAGVVDVSDGFGTYDPVRHEVLFVFGQWAYVLHLAEPQAKRWSYREYKADLGCAGLLYLTGTPAIGPTATPAITGIVSAADPSDITVSWDTVGNLVGGERYEIWGVPASDGIPVQLGSGVVADAGGTATVPVLPGNSYVVAMRYRLNGVAGGGYTSTDPTQWPAASQQNFLTPFPVPVGAPAGWERTDAANEQVSVSWAAPLTDAYVRAAVEMSTDNGATWATAFPATHLPDGVATVSGNGSGETDVLLRVHYESDWVVGTPSDPVSVYVGPDAPSNLQIIIEGIPLGSYQLAWDNNAVAADEEIWIDDGSGFVLEATVTDQVQYEVTRNCPVSFSELDAEVRHKLTQFGVDDFSKFSNIATSPPNC